MSKFEIVSGVEGECLYIDRQGSRGRSRGAAEPSLMLSRPTRGTCRKGRAETPENNFNEMGFFECSICGSTTKLDWDWHGDLGDLKYCANCGAKVVE